MTDAAAQRDFAIDIVRKLRDAGFAALWAGGCVRDQLLELTPKDYDVATSATPDQIRNLFGRRRTLPIGAAFGVVTVLGPRAAGQIEVATFRTDAAYSDGRHPDSVTFTDAEHDAQRRDFTINGLFFDPLCGEVVDYVGGRTDLEQGIVRAIGDPKLRFGEDKLRMLRAVRFAASFGFVIEPQTMHAIQSMAADITSVSAERIGMEIRRMLLDHNRAAAIRLLRESSLLPRVLPEVSALPPADFDEVLRVLDALTDPTLPTTLTVLMSRGQGAGGGELQGLRQAASTSPAAVLCGRLRYTNKESDRCAWLLANHDVIAAAPTQAWPRLQRILTHDGIAELLAWHEAIAGSADAALRFCHERLNWPPGRLNPPPLVDGSDLIRHGLKPGPQFSALLEQIRDAQLNGEIDTADEALALADRLRAAK